MSGFQEYQTGMLIVGGSFHPIHHVHLQIAYDVGTFLKVREVLFIPNFQTPGKESSDLLTPEERFKVATIEVFAFQDTHPPAPFLAVSQMELIQKKSVYTIDTLTEITKIESHRYLLIGSDQFKTFSSWKAPTEILKIARVCVVYRKDSPLPKEAVLERRVTDDVEVHLWNGQHPFFYFKKGYDDRSSHAIRDLIKQGQFDHPWLKDYQPQSLEIFKKVIVTY